MVSRLDDESDESGEGEQELSPTAAAARAAGAGAPLSPASDLSERLAARNCHRGASGAVDDSSDDDDSRGSPRPQRRPRGLPPWVKTISDSILIVRGGGRVPAQPVLRTLSLPAVLCPNEPDYEGHERQGAGRRLTKSQAALIIPRTVSEYLECCRFSRPHSGGLLLDREAPTGAFAGRHVVPLAFSQGLLAGRLFAALPSNQERRQDSPREERPPPPRPVAKLCVGEKLEGKIVKKTRSGLVLDVGATKCGLLRHERCEGVPSRLLRRGQALSNLVVLHVDAEKERFSLGVLGVDGSSIEHTWYPTVFQHIADWASVQLPDEKLASAKKVARARAKEKMAAEKRAQRSTRQWKVKTSAGDDHPHSAASRSNGAARVWVAKTADRAATAASTASSPSSGGNGSAAGRGNGAGNGGRGNGRSAGGARWIPKASEAQSRCAPKLEERDEEPGLIVAL
eukprot:TRINITY_DN2533_c0_g1_i2.p1 TRINITY_DN2533_c0_g1~~TRINITY_DN2533_c0_g1_i2.p1  ORF type:complete len:477 (+),score=74.15 TRINITY_DN2533_c0_g1_i2:67-1431(+)